jgi:hypothetical protein
VLHSSQGVAGVARVLLMSPFQAFQGFSNRRQLFGMSVFANNTSSSGVQTSRAASLRDNDNARAKNFLPLRRTVDNHNHNNHINHNNHSSDNSRDMSVGAKNFLPSQNPVRDDMPVDSRTIVVDSKSPERATSIAQGNAGNALCTGLQQRPLTSLPH